MVCSCLACQMMGKISVITTRLTQPGHPSRGDVFVPHLSNMGEGARSNDLSCPVWFPSPRCESLTMMCEQPWVVLYHSNNGDGARNE